MNPKQFLSVGGIILILVGILGFIGVIGPTSDASIFGAAWWFDNTENWAHLVIGIVGLIFAYGIKSEAAQKTITGLVGLLAIIATIVGFLFSDNFLGAIFQNPLDNILHLIIAIWAFMSMKGKVATVPAAPAGMGQ